MKKTTIAILSFVAFSNAFAQCDGAIYNAPEELQPACAQTPASSPADGTLTEKAAQSQADASATQLKDRSKASDRQRKKVVGAAKQVKVH